MKVYGNPAAYQSAGLPIYNDCSPIDRMTDSPQDVELHQQSARYQDALEQFILFWGKMASDWGINRTMAQIHALLYASEEPLDTDTVMERLSISRGNASMNLRALIEWDLIRKVHRTNSRKDFFTAEKDVWQITAQIIREREKRELRPVVHQLEACRETLTDGGDLTPTEEKFLERIENLIHLMRVFEGFSDLLVPLVEARNLKSLDRVLDLARSLQQAMRDASGNGHRS